MQNRVVRTKARFNCVACGRRWGKSFLGIRAECHPLLEGYPVGWFAPNYKILSDAFNDISRILHPVTKSLSKTDKRIELITGGIAEFWTLTDKNAGRSRKYKRVIVDEAGLVADLEDIWNESIRPTLTDYQGDGWLLGTPKGQNYFWKAFEWGQSDDRPDWASWQMPTITNPTIPNLALEVEAARLGMPERSFQQEYEAVFLEESGGVFRKVRQAVDAGRNQNEPRNDRHCTLGVDIARVEDFTVLTVVNQDGKQIYFDRFNQISWERQVSSIIDVANQYRASVILDSTGMGDPIFEQLRKVGIPVTGFHFSNSSKEQLIDHLAMSIEQDKCRLMDIPTQTAELMAYQYEVTPSRNIRMNAPQGMHDDCVIGLALAMWGNLTITYDDTGYNPLTMIKTIAGGSPRAQRRDVKVVHR